MKAIQKHLLYREAQPGVESEFELAGGEQELGGGMVTWATQLQLLRTDKAMSYHTTVRPM